MNGLPPDGSTDRIEIGQAVSTSDGSAIGVVLGFVDPTPCDEGPDDYVVHAARDGIDEGHEMWSSRDTVPLTREKDLALLEALGIHRPG